LAEAFKDYGGYHYALMSSDAADAGRRERFERDYHIHVISYRASKGHPEVTQFLQTLSDQSGGASVQHPLAPPEQVHRERELKSYRDRLIAANEYLDFRGVMQMREILRLRLEEIYVPLWATTSESQSPFPTERIKAEAEQSSRLVNQRYS
jgi:hypothetical protein